MQQIFDTGVMINALFTKLINDERALQEKINSLREGEVLEKFSLGLAGEAISALANEKIDQYFSRDLNLNVSSSDIRIFSKATFAKHLLIAEYFGAKSFITTSQLAEIFLPICAELHIYDAKAHKYLQYVARELKLHG